MDHAIDFDLLRAFVAVADRGGFTAAGQALGRTQSAVSNQIRRLEQALGTQVFRRTSRSLALTAQGELLLGYARRILDLADETVRRVSGPESSGDLKLGISDHLAPHWLTPHLARFARLYPRIDIQVAVDATTALLPQLKAGTLDLAVGSREPPALPSRTLTREPLVWAAAADWQEDPGAPLPLALIPAPCSYRDAATAALEGMGRPWRVAFTASGVPGILAGVRAGLAVSALPRSSVEADMRVLGSPDGLPDLPEVEIALFHRPGRTAKPAQAFADYLVDAIEEAA